MASEYEDSQLTNPKELVSQFIKRVKKDKDVALAISGYEGDGKSTPAVQIVIEVLRAIGKTDEEIFNDNVKIYLDIETINKKIFNL
jgi:hypothetical protein